MLNDSRLICLACAVAISGCTSVQEPETLVVTGSTTIAVGETTNGFAYSASRSGFLLGSGVVSRDEFGYRKLVGTKGTLATDMVNGSVTGLLNATTTYDPWRGSAEAHNSRALEYFGSRGLPTVEVAGVHANVALYGSSPANKEMAVDSAAREVTSIVDRKVADIPVVESRAIVRFSSGGDSVFEQVYWPAIPANVVNEALKIAAMLSSPAGAGLRNQLPASGKVFVAIHHPSFTNRGGAPAVACIDVQGAIVRHFDISGNEIRLPEEQAKGPGTAK